MPGAELAQEVVAERAETAGQIAAREPVRVSWRVITGRILCVVVPVILWFAPLNLDPTIKHTLAIASFMIIAWITEALAHALTGLIGCFLFWALRVVKCDVAFGGFADETPWFMFGAILFGMMATKSGLARRPGRQSPLVRRRLPGQARFPASIFLRAQPLILRWPNP